MLSLPSFIYKLKIEKLSIYLWRILRFALPLFVAFAIGLIGAAPEFASKIF